MISFLFLLVAKMIPDLNILHLDYKFTTVWILFEIIVSFALLSYFANRIINRKNGKKSIDKSTVLVSVCYKIQKLLIFYD